MLRVQQARDGRALDVLVAGDANSSSALVCHHGTPSDATLWSDWHEDALANNLRLVAISRPGYGLSDRQGGRSVASVTEDVEDVLDALEAEGKDPIEDAYRLEVSSPGIDRPLTRAKDFADWAGHEAKISMAKGYDGQRNLRGSLKGIDGDLVTIDDRKAGEVSIPRDQIHSAQLVLTDELIAATQPLDTSGADEIVETEEEKADD